MKHFSVALVVFSLIYNDQMYNKEPDKVPAQLPGKYHTVVSAFTVAFHQKTKRLFIVIRMRAMLQHYLLKK